MRGLDHYGLSTKKAHRAWIWQQVARRISVPVNRARVLYLLGPDPQDHGILRRKHFNLKRCYGCDINKKSVSRARRAGVKAIHGKIEDILDVAWHAGWVFDAVYFDFCCGVCRNVLGVVQNLWVQSSVSSETVVAFNMLRGRESDPGLREMIAMWRDLGLEKHRGRILIHEIANQLFLRTQGALQAELNGRPRESLFSETQWEKFSLRFLKHDQPSYYSYRSGHQIMDSVVTKIFRPWSDEELRHANAEWGSLGNESTLKSIRAAKAVETRQGIQL